MLQNSWKQSLKMGIISGAISFGVYILWFLVLIGLGTNWNGILLSETPTLFSWEIAAVAGLILISLVPVCTLRYEKIKFLFAYIPISLFTLFWLCGSALAIWFTISPGWCPFIGWDSLYFFIAILPVGSVVGTLVAMGIHLLNRD